MNTFDYQKIDEILDKHQRSKQAVIAILQDIQETYNYLPEEIFPYVAQALGIGQARLYGVATFYADFSLEPKGKHIFRCCDGTACHVRKSRPILERLRSELALKEGATTTDAGYIEEVGTSISPISWMTTNLNRIKFRGVFRDYDGEATIYESNQEPSALNQSDIAPGSIWINKNNSSNGYIFVPQEWLDQYGLTADIAADPAYAQGGWIMANYYWLRSPFLANTSYFWSVAPSGGLFTSTAASVNGLVPGFSI